MGQVLVSHSAEDRAAARAVIDALARAGLSVSGFDSSGPGGSLADQIKDNLETAGCVIWLWSQSAARSGRVQEDIHHAIRAWSAGRLILVALDDAPLPVGLRDLAPISIKDTFDAGLKPLIERVRAVVERTPAAAAVPAPSTRSRRFVPIIAAALGLVVVVAGGAALLTTRTHAPSSQPVARPAPVPAPAPGGAPPVPAPQPAPPPRSVPTSEFPSMLVMLGLGAALGAGAVWFWSRWARRRPPPGAVPTAQQALAAAGDTPLVFVSYSRQDGRTVEHLVKQIEQLGYEVWIDRHSTGSQRYAAPIVRAIRTSKLVALMCSQNAFASDHVIREVYVAGDYKKPFIAFQLDPTEFPDEVLYFVSGFPRVPVERVDLQQLRSEIARLVVV
jgi:TIR domain-containing protein